MFKYRIPKSSNGESVRYMFSFIASDNRYSIMTAPRSGSTTLEKVYSGFVNNYPPIDDFLATDYSIVILRHPVSRLWSAYKMALKLHEDDSIIHNFMQDHTLPWLDMFYNRCVGLQKFPYIIPFSAMSDYFPTQFGVATGSECMDYDDQTLYLIRNYVTSGLDKFNLEIEAYDKLVEKCEIMPLDLWEELR